MGFLMGRLAHGDCRAGIAGRVGHGYQPPMPSVTYIQPDGTPRTVEVPNATSAMMGAIRNGVKGIEAECGGACSCATCHVYVDAAWAGRLPPPDGEELEMLEGVVAERRPESRLSCQITVTESLAGLVLVLPDRQV